MQPLFVVAIYIIATSFMCCYRISLPPTMICCISHLLPPTMIRYVSYLLPPTMIRCVSHLLQPTIIRCITIYCNQQMNVAKEIIASTQCAWQL